MSRIALIDTDSLCYAAACRAETQMGDDLGLFLGTRSLEASYDNLVEDIEKLVQAVSADRAYLCLTHGTNFRLDILPTYKGNRKAQRRPSQLTALRDLLQERAPYPVLIIKSLEADDVLGITSGHLQVQGEEPVIISEDKDLKTIPGLLYQKGRLELIEEEHADYWHMFQTLTGDETDGYVGCPGVGPIAAHRILTLTPRDLWWDAVVSAYEESYKPFLKEGLLSPEEVSVLAEEDALTQARVARILRFQDWDASKGEAIQWEPPTRLDGPLAVTSERLSEPQIAKAA